MTAKKKLSLSRLFRSNSDDEEDEIENELESQEEVKEEVPQIDLCQLQLPPEHALHKLWGLHMEEQGNRMSFPVLRLEGPPEQRNILSEDDIGRELSRLDSLISSTASERLVYAIPKEQDEDDDFGTDLDAQAVVFVTGDQLNAWMLVYPPVGEGAELSKSIIDKSLEDNNIKYGLDEDLIKSLPENQEKYFKLHFIARGEAPVHGTNGKIVDLFSRTAKHELIADEFDRVDYASLNIVQNVDKGEVICQIIHPTLGKPGRNVMNIEIAARDGKMPAIPKGTNTELSEDGNTLIATRAGHVEFVGSRFLVKAALDINGNVDFSTGNINFLGDVHVHGDVRSGFIVKATGSITVDGVVEASVIEAGHDLIVAQGVTGNKQAFIRANRSIYAKYLENSRVYAREHLQSDSLINCDVYSDGVIQVKSAQGVIAGGKIRATREISANIIGSRSGAATSLYLGGLPCEEYERKILLKEIDDMELKLDKIERQPEGPAKAAHLSKTRLKISVNRMKLEQFDKDIKELKEKLQKEDLRRLMCGIAYPGIEVTIEDQVLHVEHESRKCTVLLSEGEICLLSS